MTTMFSDSPLKPLTERSGFKPTTWTQRKLRNQILAVLGSMREARVHITDADGSYQLGEGDSSYAVTIHDPRTWNEVAVQGTVGAGAAYAYGWWSCSDLVAFMRVLLRNRASLDGLEKGFVNFFMPVLRLAHWLKSNTRSGSRRNIAAHYDLGNNFFSEWLDPTMLYSSAYFSDKNQELSAAQIAKCDKLCRALNLSFDDHLLEVGTGWGGLAIHAARTYGCRVTTTTISSEQYRAACERVKAVGLEGRVQVLLSDYRDLKGEYDKIVSVEMIEAVGHRFYDTYFSTLNRLLKKNGLLALQAITITEQQYPKALKAVDFIQRYIFPGSCIPSVGALVSSVGRSTDFNLVNLTDITPHYAETLRRWRETFHAKKDVIRELGYDDQFMRMWDYYLAYCQGGFHEHAIACTHLLFARSGWRSHLSAPSANA
jgi:cyclopropane-fatty-acyl-phospholipid synthase